MLRESSSRISTLVPRNENSIVDPDQSNLIASGSETSNLPVYRIRSSDGLTRVSAGGRISIEPAMRRKDDSIIGVAIDEHER
jgi:hypothetical protein